MRILIHPGFHKTGTSSLQRGTETCAKLLAPHLRIWLTSDIIHCTRAAQIFSKRRTDEALAEFTIQFEKVLNTLDTSDPRPLLISSEDLSGLIPGRPRVKDYSATPHLLSNATQTIHRVLGRATDTIIWFTTRNREPWMRSVYWQNLRAKRITTDYDTYRPSLEGAADLGNIVQITTAQVGPQTPVLSTPIESCGNEPLGPLGTALDLLNIPKTGLPPLPAQNVQPAGAAKELLALNRSAISDDDLPEVKQQFIKKLRQKGLTRRDPGTPAQRNASND